MKTKGYHATRNLKRGQSFLLPSGESIAKCIGQEEEDKKRLENFIKKKTNGIEISSGTPLWYYILAEAECIEQGQNLGFVGASIVTEVIVGLLELDPNSYLGSNRGWTPALGAVPGDFKMADLINLVSDELQQDLA